MRKPCGIMRWSRGLPRPYKTPCSTCIVHSQIAKLGVCSMCIRAFIPCSTRNFACKLAMRVNLRAPHSYSCKTVGTPMFRFFSPKKRGVTYMLENGWNNIFAGGRVVFSEFQHYTSYSTERWFAQKTLTAVSHSCAPCTRPYIPLQHRAPNAQLLVQTHPEAWHIKVLWLKGLNLRGCWTAPLPHEKSKRWNRVGYGEW